MQPSMFPRSTGRWVLSITTKHPEYSARGLALYYVNGAQLTGDYKAAKQFSSEAEATAYQQQHGIAELYLPGWW